MSHRTYYLIKQLVRKGTRNICIKNILKCNEIDTIDGHKSIFNVRWKEGNNSEMNKNRFIHICLNHRNKDIYFFKKWIGIWFRNYHYRTHNAKEETQKENKKNEKKDEKMKSVEENIYHFQNKILNRHEQVDTCLLDIDKEIINNLKLILKIEKIYMYQYIIFYEIIKNNLKHFLVYNKTGTGKTLCYLLPIIQRLKNEMFDYKQKIFILTQNIHLCKQLYIYILSLYPNLNVCILSDEKDSNDPLKKDSFNNVNDDNSFNAPNIVRKDVSLNEKGNANFFLEPDVMFDKWKGDNAIHFYLCTPQKLEFFMKNQKRASSKNEKNVLNRIFGDVGTIIIDEFDYIVENRKLVFQFFFGRNMEQMIKTENEKSCCGNFNWDKRNIYLFTANMSDVMKKKIHEHLDGFIFFDFVNGSKEILQKGINKEQMKLKSLNTTDQIIQILSKENRNPSLCNVNVSHFICKINSASKYKYVSYFLNEFFFSKKRNTYMRKNIDEKREQIQDDILIDYMSKDSFSEYKNEEKISKCIIFANSKEEVEKLYEISFLKPHAVILHSELLSVQKDENINLFRMGKKKILIATDIVNRGLDIDYVVLILNFSPPTSPNDYIHRSGRTGRGKGKGMCLTLYHKYEYKNLEKIIKFTKNEFKVILCPDVDEVYRFSIDTLVETIMKTEPEEYTFLNDKSEELLNIHKTKIIAQILSLLLKYEKTSYGVSLLSGKKNYVAVLIKDPFFEIIRERNDIINMLKEVTKNKNISSLVGDIAKCDEGFLADISSVHVNKIINLFNNTKSEYKSKGVKIETIVELPMVIKEKNKSLRKKKKLPWINYKLQKKKIIILGSKLPKYHKKKKDEIIKEINEPFGMM